MEKQQAIISEKEKSVINMLITLIILVLVIGLAFGAIILFSGWLSHTNTILVLPD